MRQPVTVDGHEIPPDAPPGMGQDTDDVASLAALADGFRGVIPHCHYDLTGRALTVYAANFPDGPVIFNFGDGTAELTEESDAQQATATHTYARDGVYSLSVRNWNKRWVTQVAVNWPPTLVPGPEPSTDPVLTALDPSTAPNNGPLDVRCVGQNFTAQSAIFFNEIAVQTTFENPGSLMTPVDLTDVQIGDYPVRVRTGAHSTDPLTFVLTDE